MKRLERTDKNGNTVELIACNPHANLIGEKWKVLHHRDILIADLADTHDRQCVLCPEMAGQR